MKRSLFPLLLILLMTSCMPHAHWARTELYFGMSRPDGKMVSDDDFEKFLADTVSPRFPDGFTVMNAQGHWREQTGLQRTEPSRILVIFRPVNSETGRAIEEIRSAYKTRFAQKAVLRIDDLEKVAF